MHIYETVYGKRNDAPIAPVAAALMARHLAPTAGRSLEVLDIGCGGMGLTRRIADLARARMPGAAEFHLHGWDVSATGVEEAGRAGLDAQVRDITAPLPAGDSGRYDVVLFLEVLEHLVDTDAAVQNLHRLLKPDGLLVLSTPNLAAWYNRIFLLLGMQPHMSEVSCYRLAFGNAFVARCFDARDGTRLAAGHLRLFTWRALKAFLVHYGFQIVQARGVSNHAFDVVTKTVCLFGPGLAGDICLVARKRRDFRPPA